MNPLPLPKDPLAAHAQVMERAQQASEQRSEQRFKPLPEQAQALFRLAREPAIGLLSAEIIDMSAGGMRLAAFVDAPVREGDRCAITVQGSPTPVERWATVRWLEAHALIKVFGVEFED